MKNSIGKRMFTVIFVPFLLIFGVLSAYITQALRQYYTERTELEIKGIAEINAAQLGGRMESVRISVQSAATILQTLDGSAPDARHQADEILLSMLANASVYNAWLAYEPNAFDGRDSEHPSDYPGAPGGRFILSYVREGDGFIVAPDMFEETLDDPMLSPWYTVPRDEGRLFTHVDSDEESLYDYGLGGDPVCTLAISAPLYRDGLFIGCVGADVLFDRVTFGIGDLKNAEVAIFFPDGRVFYSDKPHFIETTVDNLNFSDPGHIKETFLTSESLFLHDEYSPFLDQQAFSYFYPIRSEGMGEYALYLYVAVPRAETLAGLTRILLLAAAVAITVLSVLFILLVFVISSVAVPIKALALSAEAISQGNLDTEIAFFPLSHGEIGRLSGSLHRMVEQFRVYLGEQRRLQEETVLCSKLTGILDRSEHRPEVLFDLASTLGRHFDLYRVLVISVSGGKPTVISHYDASGAPPEKGFTHHPEIAALLSSGQKLLFLNSFTMESCKVSFAARDTVSICLVPLRDKQTLRGYIIFENNDRSKAFLPATESVLLYAADILAAWLSGKTSREPNDAPRSETQTHSEHQALSEPQTPSFIAAAMALEGLNVEPALLAMGGMEDVYEKSLKLFTRTAPETIEKMDAYIETGDYAAFSIEIHGIKGALNNVGATELGALALELEKASKAGLDCSAGYKSFRELLARLLERLRGLCSDEQGADTKADGDIQALKDALQGVAGALERYDSLEALDLLSAYTDFTYDKETDSFISGLVEALELFDCERALADIEGWRAGQ